MLIASIASASVGVSGFLEVSPRNPPRLRTIAPPHQSEHQHFEGARFKTARGRLRSHPLGPASKRPDSVGSPRARQHLFSTRGARERVFERV